MLSIIEVKNLKKSYAFSKPKNGQKTFEAVKGISFAVQKGEIFGILGPNGAGKTTTLEIIECLKPQTSGQVTVLGFDNLQSPDEIKKRVGVQLQSSQYLHHLSLGELLDLFASLYPTLPSPTHGEDARRAGEVQSSKLTSPLAPLHKLERGTQALLKLVGLEGKEHAEFKDLSGGQKQRFTIATSLVHQPKILFLDEPTTGLDPKARREMWVLIKKLNGQGMTIVLTTHYMEEAEFLCHRVAVMDSGKILEIDEPKKLIDRLSDTTQISIFTDQKISSNLFQSIPEVKKILADYPKIILEISSLDKISAVVNLLKQNGIIFYGFTVKTATLEDVYLQLTGKEYEE